MPDSLAIFLRQGGGCRRTHHQEAIHVVFNSTNTLGKMPKVWFLNKTQSNWLTNSHVCTIIYIDETSRPVADRMKEMNGRLIRVAFQWRCLQLPEKNCYFRPFLHPTGLGKTITFLILDLAFTKYPDDVLSVELHVHRVVCARCAPKMQPVECLLVSIWVNACSCWFLKPI